MAREMKDSGIAWVGYIPKSWKICPLKTSIKWKSEKNHPNATILSLYRDYGIIPKDSRDDNFNVTSLDTSGYKFVEVGDLVVNKMKAWQGSIAVSDYEGIISPAYHVCYITNKAIYKKYLHYLLRNPSYLPEYMRLSTGLRIGQWDLGFDDFRNIPIIIPDIEEQQRIVAFLDSQCSHIDSIIEKTRASIEEYGKLKQAVITQAVTKGIRPDRQMKDSGIEWMGDIPAEWEVPKMKWLCENITDGSHFSPESIAEGFPYITAKDVRGVGIDYQKANKISADDFLMLQKNGCQPHKGDVLIVKDGATTGRVGLMDDDTECVLLSSVAMLTPSDTVTSKYLMYLLQSEAIQKQISISMAGSAMPRITLSKLVNFYGILCKISEQREITEYLDNKCLGMDLLIEKKEKILLELESYKKSLIYEYVTGKKEVPA